MTREVLTLSTYHRGRLAEIRDTLIEVYAEVYAAEAAADPFFSVDRFERRLDGHTSTPGWACVVGEVDGEAVGYAYGRPDSPEEWEAVLDPVSPEVRDYGRRAVFGLCEIMVRAPWRGTKVARGIHDELMQQRPEDRASLTVETAHPKVRSLYERWGYRKVGEAQPFPDSPRYDVMVLRLH
ncbi:GNAT family N-acetyltransferase [Streptomyces sp. WMMC500]|uniref:GNAT family N-acetyltransferase n=1 Tax=Streptomyces sp. WMMC500 TaxID=3015154 RepID=UPI00248CDC82|nr:GNAT family N-acetyltransferase [Streptomyces sp. WMMC500]WBB57679.1 GNAT family N-acetyltransferase [Streptomyces sp. WMMC500]